MSASAVTVSLYCHTCGARFSLPAPSSPFHFTLCPRCRRDYLDDSPAPHHAPQPAWLPPPPPPPCAVPWPSDLITSSTPPLPPPIPRISSSSSYSTARSRTLVSPCTGPSSSSTRPPPTSSGSATSSTAPVLSYCPEHSAVCREFRLLCSHEEQRRSSPAASPLSSAYSTAYSSPLLASPSLSPPLSPSLPPLHHGRQSFRLTLRLSTAADTMSTSQDLLPPPPPPWLQLESDDTWDEYFFNHFDSDDDSLPQPPPPPVSTYDTMFDMPLQRGGSQAAPPIAATDTMFDTPLQRGGSQAAPPESIAALPTVTVTDNGLVCPVCTDPLPPSAPARRLTCGHLYHSDCIVTWLSLRNSCPVCRRRIPMVTSATRDIASSSSSPSPGQSRRRSLPVPGGRRIRRICSRLLRNMEIGRDRQTNSSRDQRTNSSGDVHV